MLTIIILLPVKLPCWICCKTTDELRIPSVFHAYCISNSFKEEAGKTVKLSNLLCFHHNVADKHSYIRQ